MPYDPDPMGLGDVMAEPDDALRRHGDELTSAELRAVVESLIDSGVVEVVDNDRGPSWPI
ncbi:MAG TPA: hypothetical protein VKD67_10125 [Acidimicrobiales bacterium]|nr:hypothetical protein [Acidimicrobiales bacterium]